MNGKFVQVKPSINNCGYEFICYKDHKIVYVHKLVYEAFKGEIPNGMEIDHIDRNKHNNNPDNLRVVTRIENCKNRDMEKIRNRCKMNIGTPRSEFGKKFKEHYGIKNNQNTKLYNTEHSWYYRHNKKCRWEK